MTMIPIASETTIVRVSTTGDLAGSPTPIASNSALMPSAKARPPTRPRMAPIGADQQRLEDDRGEDLAARGAERAQQPELAHPLGDGDREGVEDQEGADEQRHAGEDQQRHLQEAEVVADLARLAVGVLLSGLDPGRIGQGSLDSDLAAGRR